MSVHAGQILSERKWCSSCGAPIVWATTVAGKRMPLDPDPLTERPENMLGVFVLNDEGLAVGATSAPGITAGRPLYMSHWGTCPSADRHRRK